MKSRFSRPICWSVLLFCLAYDVRADTPSAASESAAPPARTVNDNKPVLIDTERIQGHQEYDGEAELRLGGAAEHETEVEFAAADTEAASEKNKKIFISADRLQGHLGNEIEAIGGVEMSNGDQFISAERMKYHQHTDEAEAEGSVRVEQRGDILEGSKLKFNMASKTGQLNQPNYRLKDASSRGYAETLLFEGENRYRLQKATYTTCPAGDNDWFIQVSDLKLNHEKKKGTAKMVKLTFLDIPVLYTPWMSFSYNGQRKSGLLAPLYGYSARRGFDLTVPFYWNIAPDYDATLAARYMSRRGVSFNGEFRYLGERSSGTWMGEILPNDSVYGHTRWHTSFFDDRYLGNGVSTRLDYNRVSDPLFFRDFGNSLNVTSRTNLLQQAVASYDRALGDDGALKVNALVQSFQTIQQPFAPIIPPYKRLPQFTIAANKPDILGAELSFNGSWTDFSHPTLISGSRLVLFPNISYPLRNSFGYITPKVGVHYTSYQLDTSAQGENPTRTLPIFSLDSGIALDRGIKLGGQSYTQTLEPRLFYVYIPYRNQSQLPNFDSATMDFNFPQIFNYNRFSGSDRIGDTNQVTMALTTRLIEPGSGRERVRAAVGQQISFIDRRVTLTAPGTLSRRPDLVANVTGFITPTITTDSSLQYDETRLRVSIIRSGLSYRPEPGRVLNVGYQLTRDVLSQIITSGQWRWSQNWQSVGRLSYSLQDGKILEGLAGLEYSACCWSMRFVAQKLVTSVTKTTTAFFVQFELNGLLQVGSNPLTVLQRGIPGYTLTGSQGSTPSNTRPDSY